jgi:hypothetical protein
VVLLGLPLLGIAGLAAWAVPWATLAEADGPLLLALLGAPFVFIGFSLTATLTPEYANTVYRASTFLHFPATVLAGLSVATILVTWARHRPVGKIVIAGGVVLAAAVAIPIAFGGLSLLDYKGVTTPGEYHAAGFAERHTAGWAGDNHLVRITWAGEDRLVAPNGSASGSAGRVEPVFAWLAARGPPPACPTLTQHSWTTVGAQFYPHAPVSLAPARLAAWQETNHVVYRGGSDGDPIRLVWPRGDGC